MAVNIASSSSSAWLLPPPTVCLLPSYRISERFRRGIHFLKSSKNTTVLLIWEAQISIISVSQTKEFINNTGNRGQVCFPICPGRYQSHPCIKAYETCEVELWCVLLPANIFRRQNVKVRFCLGNFNVSSLDMSGEFR